MRAAADLTDVARWAGLWPFAGYEPWLSWLAQGPGLQVEHLASVLRTDVVFSASVGKLAAGLDASDIDGSYADRCAQRTVPTRRDNLHDLLNALTWARFPRAKHALCARQLGLARARGVIDAGSLRVRNREQDACAMLDEGGMVLGPTQQAIFGHAALEDAVIGRELRPFLVRVDTDDLDEGLTRLLQDPQPIPRVRERHLVLPK